MKKVLDKINAADTMPGSMLKILMDFINECEVKNRVPKGPQDLPKNFLVDSRLYYITSLLNNRFNKKYTFAQVEQMLNEEKIAKRIEDTIPQWYSDKWFK